MHILYVVTLTRKEPQVFSPTSVLCPLKDRLQYLLNYQASYPCVTNMPMEVKVR
jgi:hypothetical protein